MYCKNRWNYEFLLKYKIINYIHNFVQDYKFIIFEKKTIHSINNLLKIFVCFTQSPDFFSACVKSQTLNLFAKGVRKF